MPSRLRPRDTKKPKIQITNINAQTQLVPPFNLSSLATDYPLVEKFPGKFFKLESGEDKDKKAKFSIFLSGTIISRGSSSFSMLDATFAWLRNVLTLHGLEFADHYDITNIAASSDLFCSFHLYELATHLLNSSYDPSPTFSDKDEHLHLLDCIVYRFHERAPRYTSLIFPSGKVIFTGFKSLSVLESHALKLSSLLSEISLNHPEVLVK